MQQQDDEKMIMTRSGRIRGDQETVVKFNFHHELIVYVEVIMRYLFGAAVIVAL